MSMNSCALILSGTLGADVEFDTVGGTACARFSVTTTYPYPCDDGERKIETTRTRIVAFGALALTIRRLGMGSRVFLRARLREAAFGCGPARFTYPEIVAVSVKVDEQVSRIAPMEPPMIGVMEPPTSRRFEDLGRWVFTA